MRLTHIRLLVNDLATCFRFYRDVLGLQPAFGSEHDVYAEFEAGPCLLALFQAEAMAAATGLPAEPPRGDRTVLCLTVEDLDRSVAQLQARGAQLVAAPADRPEWGLRTAHLRDPEGNLIEISHPIPMHA